MSHDARSELLRADWEDIGIRLAAYATWKAGNLRWRTGQTNVLAAGKTPEDVAADAILKVLEHKRVWDPQRGPLLPYLRRVVDSLMNQLADGADNRTQQRLPDVEGEPALRSFDETIAAPSGRTPLSSVASAGSTAKLGEADPEERIDRLRAALAREHKEDLIAVLDAVSLDCEPRPQAIASYLGTTVADINNRLKRLRRFAQKLAKPIAARAGVARQ